MHYSSCIMTLAMKSWSLDPLKAILFLPQTNAHNNRTTTLKSRTRTERLDI